MITQETQDKRFSQSMQKLLNLTENPDEFVQDCIHIFTRENVQASYEEVLKLIAKKEKSRGSAHFPANKEIIDAIDNYNIVKLQNGNTLIHLYKTNDNEYTLLTTAKDLAVEAFILDAVELHTTLGNYDKFISINVPKDTYNDEEFNYAVSKAAQMHNVDNITVTQEIFEQILDEGLYVVNFNYHRAKGYVFNVNKTKWLFVEHDDGQGSSEFKLHHIESIRFDEMENAIARPLSTMLIEDKVFNTLYNDNVDELWNCTYAPIKVCKDVLYTLDVLGDIQCGSASIEDMFGPHKKVVPIEDEIADAYKELDDKNTRHEDILDALKHAVKLLEDLNTQTYTQTELLKSQNMILEETKDALKYVAAAQR